MTVKDMLSKERGCCQALSNTTRNMVRVQLRKAFTMGSALSTYLSETLISKHYGCTDLGDCYSKMTTYLAETLWPLVSVGLQCKY